MISSNTKPLSRLLLSITKVIFVFILVSYVIIWIFSPFAVRHFAAKPLQELGVTLSDDSSVRYNPFASTLSVNELELWNKDNNVVLSVSNAQVSIHLHRLLIKQVYVSEFLLDSVSVNIVKDQQSVIVAGVDVLPSTSTTKSANNNEQGDRADSNFSVVIPELQLIEVLFDAEVDGVPQKILLNELLLRNAHVNQKVQEVELSIQAKVNDAPLALSAEVDMQSGFGNITSTFALEQLDLASFSPLLTDLGVNISGFFSAHGNPEMKIGEKGMNVSSDKIALSVSNLGLNYAPWLVSGENDLVTINNLNLFTTSKGDVKQLTATIVTDLSQGNIGLKTTDNSIINWGNINLSTDIELLDMQPNIAIVEIIATELNLSEDLSLDDASPILHIAQLEVSDVQFSDNSLSVDTISIAGLKTDIKVKSDKSIVSLVDTSALNPAVPEQTNTSEMVELPNESLPIAAESVSEQEGLVFALNKFKLDDFGYIHITDQSVSPMYEHNITIEALQAGPFDSADYLLESPFEIVAKDGNFLKIVAQGHASPFADRLNALLTAKISELNLPSVSPYVKDGLGFEMKSGQLDVNVDLTIKDDELNGETSLSMRGIEMASANEVEKGTLKEGKAMSLNVALGLLKDDQGNIKLDVPLRGNVSDPSFGVESFLGLVLKKAAMSQAKTYLMTTFVPYASVVSVAISGAEYLLKVKFEPLVFQTNKQDLTGEHQQYLSELVLLMTDKPALQLKTCAIVTYQDLALPAQSRINVEQQAQLKLIGDERQDKLKRYLIEQDIDSSRILYCAPELDTQINAKPRIELKTD
jgi:hypothetical protein